MKRKKIDLWEDYKNRAINCYLVTITKTDNPNEAWCVGQGRIDYHKGIENEEKLVWGEPLKEVIPYKRKANALRKAEAIERFNRFLGISYEWDVDVIDCRRF